MVTDLLTADLFDKTTKPGTTIPQDLSTTTQANDKTNGIDIPLALTAAQNGNNYLLQHARTFLSESETGLAWKDNFLDALLLEITANWSLVDLRIPAGKWNYFGGKPCSLTTDPYPDDIDTQCLLATIVRPVDEVAHKLMDEILENETVDGIVNIYFGSSRLRICPEVSADVCCLFYTYGRGDQVQPSLSYVLDTLTNRAWHVSRYYATPEPLFWFSLRLYKADPHDPKLQHLADLLKSVVTERIGREGMDNPVSLAIRLLICQVFDVPNREDLMALLKLQGQDGSWDQGWYYAFGMTKVRIQHRGFTTAMAVEAIKGALGLHQGGGLLVKPVVNGK